MNLDNLLTAFAGDCKDPRWRCDQYAYASDSAAAVVVPLTDDHGSLPHILDRLKPGGLTPDGEWQSWVTKQDGTVTVMVACDCEPVQCEECGGGGYQMCDLGHEHECVECDGLGDTHDDGCNGRGKEAEVPTWAFGESRLQDKYVQLVKEHLGECKWAPSKGVPGAVIFRAGDVLALVLDVE